MSSRSEYETRKSKKKKNDADKEVIRKYNMVPLQEMPRHRAWLPEKKWIGRAQQIPGTQVSIGRNTICN